jgi:hypothetical protein
MVEFGCNTKTSSVMGSGPGKAFEIPRREKEKVSASQPPRKTETIVEKATEAKD